MCEGGRSSNMNCIAVAYSIVMGTASFTFMIDWLEQSLWANTSSSHES